MNARLPIYILILIIVLSVFIIWYFWGIIVYLIVAAIISLIGRPVMHLLQQIRIRQYKLPNSVNAILTIAILLGIFVLLIVLFTPVIIQQTQNIENINVESIESSLKEPIQAIEQFATTYRLSDSTLSIETYFRENVIEVISSIRFSSVINSVLGFTGDIFVALFSIVFILFFFLKDEGLLGSIVMAATPEGYEQRVNKVLTRTKELLTRYFIGVVLEVVLVGGLISAGLGLLGIENAVAIGFFAGIFNVIPYLGPIIGALTGVSLAILGNLELDFYSQMVPLILKVAVVFLIVQLIDNFVFQPFIYSSSVKAHPLEIFLVILMAGSFAGVGGMILAIPTYTMFRVISKEFFNQFKVVQSITKRI